MWYTIDPDGATGPIKPFNVKCKRNGNYIETEVTSSLETKAKQ